MTTHGIGGDYSDVLHRVYFELGEHEGFARSVLHGFLLDRSEGGAQFPYDDSLLGRRDGGYEVRIPAQIIPEVVRALATRNIAVYQVVSDYEDRVRRLAQR